MWYDNAFEARLLIKSAESKGNLVGKDMNQNVVVYVDFWTSNVQQFW